MDTFEAEFEVITVDREEIAEGDLECCYLIAITGGRFREWVGSDSTDLVEGQTYKGRITIDTAPYVSPYDGLGCNFRRIVEVYS